MITPSISTRTDISSITKAVSIADFISLLLYWATTSFRLLCRVDRMPIIGSWPLMMTPSTSASDMSDNCCWKPIVLWFFCNKKSNHEMKVSKKYKTKELVQSTNKISIKHFLKQNLEFLEQAIKYKTYLDI